MGVREIAEKWFTAVEMTTSHLRDPSDWPSHTLEIFWRLNPLHKSSQINSNGIQDIYPPFLEKWWFSDCDFTKRIARECTWMLVMEKSGLFNGDFALDSVLAKAQISELIIFFKVEDCLCFRLLMKAFIIWIHKVYTQYLVVLWSSYCYFQKSQDLNTTANWNRHYWSNSVRLVWNQWKSYDRG